MQHLLLHLSHNSTDTSSVSAQVLFSAAIVSPRLDKDVDSKQSLRGAEQRWVKDNNRKYEQAFYLEEEKSIFYNR